MRWEESLMSLCEYVCGCGETLTKHSSALRSYHLMSWRNEEEHIFSVIFLNRYSDFQFDHNLKFWRFHGIWICISDIKIEQICLKSQLKWIINLVAPINFIIWIKRENILYMKLIISSKTKKKTAKTIENGLAKARQC